MAVQQQETIMSDNMRRRVRFVQINTFPTEDEGIDVIYALDDHGFVWKASCNISTNKIEWTRLDSPNIDIPRPSPTPIPRMR